MFRLGLDEVDVWSVVCILSGPITMPIASMYMTAKCPLYGLYLVRSATVLSIGRNRD